MTTTTAEDIHTVTGTVESASKAQGKNGLQWQLKVLVPEISKFAMPLYLDTALAPSDILAGQPATLTIRKGKLKKGKTGQYNSDYYWDIVQWGAGPVSQAPAPTTAPQQQQAPSSIDERIAWNSAINNAVTSIGTVMVMDDDARQWSVYMRVIEGRANAIYALIRRGPTPAPYTDTGEAPTQAPSSPQETPKQTQGNRSIADLLGVPFQEMTDSEQALLIPSFWKSIRTHWKLGGDERNDALTRARQVTGSDSPLRWAESQGLTPRQFRQRLIEGWQDVESGFAKLNPEGGEAEEV